MRRSRFVIGAVVAVGTIVVGHSSLALADTDCPGGTSGTLIDVKGYLLLPPSETCCPTITSARAWVWLSDVQLYCGLIPPDIVLDSDDNVAFGPVSAGVGVIGPERCGDINGQQVSSAVYGGCGPESPFMASRVEVCSEVCCSDANFRIASGRANAFAALQLCNTPGYVFRLSVSIPLPHCSAGDPLNLGRISRSFLPASLAGGPSGLIGVIWTGECERPSNLLLSTPCIYSGVIDVPLSGSTANVSTSVLTFTDSVLDLNGDGRFNSLDVTGASGLEQFLSSPATDSLEFFDFDHDLVITAADVAFLQSIVDADLSSGVFGDVSGDGVITCADLFGATLYPTSPAVIKLCDTAYDIRLDYNLDGVLDATDAAAFATLTANILDPDFNHDGLLDFSDFDDFTTAFENGLPSADFNRDSVIDFTDFDDFVAAFETGC